MVHFIRCFGNILPSTICAALCASLCDLATLPTQEQGGCWATSSTVPARPRRAGEARDRGLLQFQHHIAQGRDLQLHAGIAMRAFFLRDIGRMLYAAASTGMILPMPSVADGSRVEHLMGLLELGGDRLRHSDESSWRSAWHRWASSQTRFRANWSRTRRGLVGQDFELNEIAILLGHRKASLACRRTIPAC